MQSHIQTLVKHLFNKDSFDQVTVQELKQFTEAYPYAAAGHFLYAKKLYDARSWNYYEQTEQASLYFHNPLWYSWLMEQKYDAPVVAPVPARQEETLAQPSAYRVVVQMPKGVAPLTTSPPESEKEFSNLHEFDAKPDAEPIEAGTETFGDIQAPAEEYTEAVTDNTGEEPQPLTQEEPTSGVETVADITAAKEEIETTPEFFAEAAQPVEELPVNTVALAENRLGVDTESIEENLGVSTPIGFEIDETPQENIPVELMEETTDPDGLHAASDLTPSGFIDETATAEPVAYLPLQEDLTAEHTIDEPVKEEQPIEPQPVTEEEPEKTTEPPAETSPAQESEPVTAVEPQPITETEPATTTEEQPEQPAETSPEQEQEEVTAVEPQPIIETEPETATEPPEAPAEEEPVTEEEPQIVEEPTGPAADLEPELQAPPEPVAEEQAPQPVAEQQEESIALPGLADLPPVSAFTPASTEPKTAIDTEEPIFESYHTIDYFASQGIKLQQEDYKDRLGKQLKTFSEWLRSMKRLAPVTESSASLDDVTNQSIQRIADHSVEEKEIITEAMAEVWAKQGHREKAISVYEKLKLQNPAKSAYFAGRIDQLKA